MLALQIHPNALPMQPCFFNGLHLSDLPACSLEVSASFNAFSNFALCICFFLGCSSSLAASSLAFCNSSSLRRFWHWYLAGRGKRIKEREHPCFVLAQPLLDLNFESVTNTKTNRATTVQQIYINPLRLQSVERKNPQRRHRRTYVVRNMED